MLVVSHCAYLFLHETDYVIFKVVTFCLTSAIYLCNLSCSALLIEGNQYHNEFHCTND